MSSSHHRLAIFPPFYIAAGPPLTLWTIGSFQWDGVNFSDSAENVHFAIEGGGEVPVLRATLMNEDGEGFERDLNLSERISNNDGNFEFSK